MLKRFLLVGVLFFVTACGGSDSPSAPSAPQPAQVAGVWRGTYLETSVTGGECFANVFPVGIGASAPVSVALTQSGATVNATATLTNTGGNYTFGGSMGQSAITMNATFCSACNLIGAHCPNSTATRDIKLQTAGFNGTVSGNSMTGTETETYNVFVAGTSSAVGSVTFSYSFNLTRQ